MVIDSFVVIFCIFCLIRGVFRGTVKEAFSIAGIFIGLIVAAAFYSHPSHVLFGWVANPRTGYLLGFLMLFGITYFLMDIFGILTTYLFHIVTKGWSSRLTGGVAGSLRGVLLVSVLLIPLITFLPDSSKFVKASKLFSMESSITEQMTHLTPKGLQNKFNANFICYQKGPE